MDFSIVLVLPFAAIVASAVLLAAAAAKRPKPRLIWSLVFSAIAAMLVFLRPPEAAASGYWLLSFILLVLWAAIGTIIGAIVAKVVITAARLLGRR